MERIAPNRNEPGVEDLLEDQDSYSEHAVEAASLRVRVWLDLEDRICVLGDEMAGWFLALAMRMLFDIFCGVDRSERSSAW